MNITDMIAYNYLYKKSVAYSSVSPSYTKSIHVLISQLAQSEQLISSYVPKISGSAKFEITVKCEDVSNGGWVTMNLYNNGVLIQTTNKSISPNTTETFEVESEIKGFSKYEIKAFKSNENVFTVKSAGISGAIIDNGQNII